MIGSIDSSVFLARFLGEERSRHAGELMGQCSAAVVSRVAAVEVRRGLSFIPSSVERALAHVVFEQQWRGLNVMDVDSTVAGLATDIASTTGVKTLDSLHIATAVLAEVDVLITFDRRQAQAAQAYDITVLGVDEDPS